MSSLAADPRPEPAEARATPPARPLLRWLGAHPDPPIAVALAALLLGAVFVARGFTADNGPVGRLTTTEIAVTLLGELAATVAALVAPTGRRLWGGVTVLLLAALTAYTALSIIWAIEPAGAWDEANLALSYFAAFAGAAALVRVAPARWRALLGALVLTAVVVSAYSLLTKVYPSIVAAASYARLRAPFDYWNAVGLMAVLGIPGCLWLGARRDGHPVLGALAVPGLGVLLTAVVLSVGRGALLATLFVLVLWFAAVPLRLRSAAVLATAGAGAAIVSVWALSNDALSKDGVPQAIAARAGHNLGLLLVAMVIVLAVAGLFLSFAMARSAIPPLGRRRLGTLVLVLVALVPLAGIARLATSDRGLTGSISHGWRQLTDPNAVQPGNDPSRIASVGSVRARYWNDAITVGKRAPWTGVGANGYATARDALQPTQLRVTHAHGYVAQTFADLGLIGLGLNALVLVAWLVAAGRATALRRPRWLRWPRTWAIPGPWGRPAASAAPAAAAPATYAPALGAGTPAAAAYTPAPAAYAPAPAYAPALAAPAAHAPALATPAPIPEATPERIGLMALAITALAFCFHSAIDWTYYIPGDALVACLAAGWVAGRGPLADVPPAGRLPRGWRIDLTRLAVAVTVLAAGLAAAWVIYQPQRSANASGASLDALFDGHDAAAVKLAQKAADINPLSVDPLESLASAQQAQNQPAAALGTLERAVRLQLANPEPWLQLGTLQLQQGQARDAVTTLAAALYLDPRSPIAQDEYDRALAVASGG